MWALMLVMVQQVSGVLHASIPGDDIEVWDASRWAGQFAISTIILAGWIIGTEIGKKRRVR